MLTDTSVGGGCSMVLYVVNALNYWHPFIHPDIV